MPLHPPRNSTLLLCAIALALGGAGLVRAAAGPPATTDTQQWEQTARPQLKQYCNSCHNSNRPSGGVDLTAYSTLAEIQRNQNTWRKVLTQLRERSMPPKGAAQPSEEVRHGLINWLQHTLDSTDDSLIPKNPGRVLIHRLSRTEYNNTVRDLFGVTSRPADKFPADGGGGGGFDNNADTLFIPPILMERYLIAAGDVLKEAPDRVVLFVRPSKTLPARAAARRVLAHFALRAYRRPVTPAEVDRLVTLYDGAAARKQPFGEAVRFALKALLVSPNFLFRVEADNGAGGERALNDWELASRLSYFLWSSLPDDELIRLATAGKLHQPAVLDAQVHRMLQDPKSRALADSFAGQWLRVKELYTSAQPDPRRYPTYTPTLRDAMFEETVDFFLALLQNNAPVTQLLDAHYTYLNEELAKHYGITGVTGPQFRRVELPDGKRGGVLTMASVLTITSYAQRTSPVLRGKWVLEQVLGAPVPPPPPNAGGLSQDDRPSKGLSFRQRLEVHREKPQCASCHARMDPVGFGLENFDAIGRWRTEIGGQPVDASGVLATGEKFSGPEELRRLILARKDDFTRNLAEKLLSYALGRGMEPYDLPAIRRIATDLEKDGYRSETLVREVVKSYPFQYRSSG